MTFPAASPLPVVCVRAPPAGLTLPLHPQDEQVEGVKEELTTAELQQKVKEYNAQVHSNLFMNSVSCFYLFILYCVVYMFMYCPLGVLSPGSSCFFFCFFLCWQNKDGSYTGFIKVQFKLARPVSVPPPKKGGNDVRGKKGGGVTRRTSFYLPKDASKHLHISSRTSAREVIEALLKKFTVVDNPAKFALFERSERHDQGIAAARRGSSGFSSRSCTTNPVRLFQFTSESCLTASGPSACG